MTLYQPTGPPLLPLLSYSTAWDSYFAAAQRYNCNLYGLLIQLAGKWLYLLLLWLHENQVTDVMFVCYPSPLEVTVSNDRAAAFM